MSNTNKTVFDPRLFAIITKMTKLYKRFYKSQYFFAKKIQINANLPQTFFNSPLKPLYIRNLIIFAKIQQFAK